MTDENSQAKTVPEKVIETLLQREPSSEEIAMLYRMKDQLGLSDNDAIWTMLLSFGTYHIMFSEMPDKILQAMKEGLESYSTNMRIMSENAERQQLLRTELNTSESIKRLVEMTEKGAKALNTATHKRRLTIVAAVSVALASAALIGAIWTGFIIGHKSTSADLVWLNSPEGQAARKFASLNNPELMMDCAEPQQKIQRDSGTWCLPYEASSKTVRMYRIK